MIKDGAKMSKSKGNIVSPEEIVKKYGADTAWRGSSCLPQAVLNVIWSGAIRGVEGAARFLGRLWRIVHHFADAVVAGPAGYDAASLDANEKELRRALHATIRKVTDDVADRFNFNTAISSIMELVNAMYAYRDAAVMVQPALLRETVEALLRLLAPFAPHIAEEIWQQLERSGSNSKPGPNGMQKQSRPTRSRSWCRSMARSATN